MAISILCSIGFIPRELFVAESKGTKILCLCEFGEKKKKEIIVRLSEEIEFI